MILSFTQLEVFFFILARIAGVFLQAPLLSSSRFPSLGKTAFVIWLTFVLWFVTPVNPVLPTTAIGFVITLVAEVAFGFLIGFVCNLLFTAVQASGEIIDMQMGLSVAQALDPVFGAVISIVGRLVFNIALIVFLTLNGHHLVLSALHQSFTAIPAGKIANFGNYNLTVQLGDLGSALWLSAIKIAAPVVLLIFLADFTFGIVSRVAPQVNVFMLGFQVKPILGLFGISLLSPFLVKYIEKMIETMGSEVIKLIAILK